MLSERCAVKLANRASRLIEYYFLNIFKRNVSNREFEKVIESYGLHNNIIIVIE